MANIHILESCVLTSQGDMQGILRGIKNATFSCDIKEVNTLDGKQNVPYFLLKEHIADEKDAITFALKKIVLELVKNLTKEEKSQTALLVGTALLDKNVIDAVEDKEEIYENSPASFRKTSLDSYANDIAQELGLNSFSMTIATACTSSMNALFEAKNLINAGVVQRAVVVGVEIVSDMMSDGFVSMNLLSLTEQKPFDVSRDGLILGEAIAGVLIAKEYSPWRLLGGYSNCNSHTITSVSEGGEEFREVMSRAMDLSGVNAEDITLLKAHATSSYSNDLAEINAISQLFDKHLSFTALKPYFGHTLGACGILEMAVIMACVDEDFVPKTLGCEQSISEEYVPLLEHKKCKSGTFMLNYFGFGGNNTTVIIKKELL